MMDLMYRVCKAGELVLSTSASTLAITKKYLQVQEPCRTVNSEKLSPRFQDVRLLLVVIYKRKVFNLQSDTAESKEAVALNKVLVKEMAAVASAGTVFSLTLRHGLLPVQTISVHITFVIGNLYQHGNIFEKWRYTVHSQWSDKWRAVSMVLV